MFARMSPVVVHVLESSNPDAGSVSICLDGLHKALTSHGMESKALTPPADAARALGAADVVHIHGWGYALAERMAAAAHQAGKPYIIAPQGSLTYGPYHKPTWKDRLRFAWRTRRLIRGAACLTAMNPLEEQDLRAQNIHSTIHILPYGLRFDEYGLGLPDETVTPASKSLLVLGSFHPRDGCVALLKAIAEIGPDADGWKVVLAGSDGGEWRKMLESAVRRKKGEDRVSFAAAATVAVQRALLAQASLLASPGLHIGPPVSIMQAVAGGVPAIASTCTAPPELDGAIRVFEPRREAMRETLRSVLKLPDESRRAMAQRARTAARALLDWSVLADRYVRLYKDVAEMNPNA